MPQTQIVRSASPSSVISASIVRSASGSPQPGQSECCVDRSSSGLAETFLSSAAGVLMGVSRSGRRPAAVDLGDPGDDVGRLERGADPEPGGVVADAADGN